MRKIGSTLLWAALFVLVPMVALAETGAGGDSNSWGYALGAGLAIGLAALGCGIGQGLTAGNTTAGIARNPGAAGAMFQLHPGHGADRVDLDLRAGDRVHASGQDLTRPRPVKRDAGRELDAGPHPVQNPHVEPLFPPGDPGPAHPRSRQRGVAGVPAGTWPCLSKLHADPAPTPELARNPAKTGAYRAAPRRPARAG